MDGILNLLSKSESAERDKTTFFKAQVIFWMLCATDGHAKNFSIFLRPGSKFGVTLLYDVLSVSPTLGAGPNNMDPRAVRMAMSARSQNAHWKMITIMRHHWVPLGRRHSIQADAVIKNLIARTPKVINEVSSMLPVNFPETIEVPIFKGIISAAKKIGVVTAPRR